MSSKLPRVGARVSPATRKRIHEAAARAGLRPCRWVLRALLRALDEDAGKDGGQRPRVVQLVVNLNDGSVTVVSDGVVSKSDPAQTALRSSRTASGS